MHLCDMNFGSEIKWDKAFKNGPSKVCGRQSHIPLNFVDAVFHKFFLVHS